MKKYLFVIPSLSKGGAERVVSILANKLVQENKKVTVIVHFKAEKEYPISDTVKIVNLSHLYEKEYRKRISPLYLCKLLLKLRKAICQENPDYILPFLWTTCIRVDLALIFKKKYKLRVIQTVRNNPDKYPSKRLLKVYRDYLIEKSEMTLVQNDDQKKYFDKHIHNKIYILPNPISDELLSLKYKTSRDGELRIIGVGRLEKQKNFELLIDAFYKVNQEYSNCRLDIYGEGSLKDKLQAKIEKMNMQEKIELKGRSNSYEEIYGSASIFVLSSDFEGMPNTLLEAMAVGIPSISTDCPTGPKDIIINGENGYLVPVAGLEMMKGKMLLILLDCNLREKLSENARKTILKNYSAEVITKQLVFLCEGNNF